MIIKKFEAPTIQEALETIKRELGPEAIILHTRKNRGGFGLMSKPSVEVTATISERALQRMEKFVTKLKEPDRESVSTLSAGRQAELLEKYTRRDKEKEALKERRKLPFLGKKSGDTDSGDGGKRLTATRYIDIVDTDASSSGRPLPEKNQARGLVERKQEPPAGPEASKVAAMENELRHLKQIIAEMKDREVEKSSSGSGVQALTGTGTFHSPAMQDVFEQLVVGGLEKGNALTLLKEALFDLGGSPERHTTDEVMDQLAVEIMENTEVLSLLDGLQPKTEDERRSRDPSVVVLVGPTGVGKTTTVAKIASEAMHRRQLAVGLINIDTYKVGAVDHLATYAAMLGAPFRSITDADDLDLALREFAHLDLILIDTTGRSQRDEESLRETQKMIRSIQGVRTELVLSATTRDTELYDMGVRFMKLFRPEGLIMSKLDEAMSYGSIYNVSQKLKLPLLYFTTGQRVPEDIEEASRERVVSLVLEI